MRVLPPRDNYSVDWLHEFISFAATGSRQSIKKSHPPPLQQQEASQWRILDSSTILILWAIEARRHSPLIQQTSQCFHHPRLRHFGRLPPSLFLTRQRLLSCQCSKRPNAVLAITLTFVPPRRNPSKHLFLNMRPNSKIRPILSTGRAPNGRYYHATNPTDEFLGFTHRN